jgi:predicted nuclease of predicted toxin-antitoxin system
MRILADEEMESLTVHRLRNYGHDVVHVARRDDLRGSSDSRVSEVASDKDRLVLTHDNDFLQLSDEHNGILFVPNSNMPSEKVADAVNEISKRVSQDEIDSVVYVTEGWL